jgi:hypothetical protein
VQPGHFIDEEAEPAREVPFHNGVDYKHAY